MLWSPSCFLNYEQEIRNEHIQWWDDTKYHVNNDRLLAGAKNGKAVFDSVSSRRILQNGEFVKTLRASDPVNCWADPSTWCNMPTPYPLFMGIGSFTRWLWAELNFRPRIGYHLRYLLWAGKCSVPIRLRYKRVSGLIRGGSWPHGPRLLE
jgi:hypothetical protein